MRTREEIALGAAAQTLLLINDFNGAAVFTKYFYPGSLKVEIYPVDESYASLFTGERIEGNLRRVTEEKDTILLESALIITSDAAEQVVHNLPEKDPGSYTMRALLAAIAQNVSYSSAFRTEDGHYKGASKTDLQAMTRESFALAVNAVKNNRQSFNNLVHYFHHNDTITGARQMLKAANTAPVV